MENTNERFWIKDILKGDALIHLDKTNFSLTVMQGNKTYSPQTIVVKKEKAHELHAWLTDQLGIGWVSVNDKKPKEKTVVLIYNGTVHAGFYYDYGWYSWPIMRASWDYIQGATHWMPITPPEVK